MNFLPDPERRTTRRKMLANTPAKKKSSQDLPDKMESYVYQIDAPSGRFFVDISENIDTGRPIAVVIQGLKNGSPLAAWAQALMRMCTRALVNGDAEIADILNELSDITTDKARRNADGITARSDIEGFVVALQAYQTDKLREMGIGNSFDPAFDRGNG
jgi:hypothetical protein